MKRILFFGSRPGPGADPTYLQARVRAAVPACVEKYGTEWILIHGGARGVDRWAAEEARAFGVHCAQVDALWDFHGKRAGPIRNSAMLALAPHGAFGVWDGQSRGTAHMGSCCIQAGIPLLVSTPTGREVQTPTQRAE